MNQWTPQQCKRIETNNGHRDMATTRSQNLARSFKWPEYTMEREGDEFRVQRTGNDAQHFCVNKHEVAEWEMLTKGEFDAHEAAEKKKVAEAAGAAKQVETRKAG